MWCSVNYDRKTPLTFEKLGNNIRVDFKGQWCFAVGVIYTGCRTKGSAQ
jgi:hypothetical protein